MPNKWTFTILPIKKLLQDLTDDYSGWCDPFAGMHSRAGQQMTYDKVCLPHTTCVPLSF